MERRFINKLLTLDVILALFTKDNNVVSDYSLPWKRDVILNKTAFFIKTYYHIINFCISNQLQHIRALNYLLNDTCISNRLYRSFSYETQLKSTSDDVSSLTKPNGVVVSAS